MPDCRELHQRAWVKLAEESQKAPIMGYDMKRLEGMKTSQAISEVLCWSRNPSEVWRLARRKDELFAEEQLARFGDYFAEGPNEGVRAFLEMLQAEKIPCAVGSTDRAQVVDVGLTRMNLRSYFEQPVVITRKKGGGGGGYDEVGMGQQEVEIVEERVDFMVIGGDDVEVGKPDPELFLVAAHKVGRQKERCIVVTSTNTGIEAAHMAGMKCIAVCGSGPRHTLSSADLVVSRVSELSFVNLKNLFSREELVALETQAEPNALPA